MVPRALQVLPPSAGKDRSTQGAAPQGEEGASALPGIRLRAHERRPAARDAAYEPPREDDPDSAPTRDDTRAAAAAPRRLHAGGDARPLDDVPRRGEGAREDGADARHGGIRQARRRRTREHLSQRRDTRTFRPDGDTAVGRRETSRRSSPSTLRTSAPVSCGRRSFPSGPSRTRCLALRPGRTRLGLRGRLCCISAPRRI